MADPAHPTTLRPGGPSPSPSNTSRPDSQEEMAGRASAYGGFNPDSDHSGPQSTTSYQSSQRFPSSQYGAPQNFPVESPGTSSALEKSLPESLSRSRASTGAQNYTSPSDSSIPNMPAAQPLFAQHSGAAGQYPPSSSSRPQSRHPPSQAMNPSVLQPGFTGSNSAGPSTRPGTSGAQSAARSPFSPPIQSPPRSRPSQILLINPTSTQNLTTTMLNTLRPILPPQLEIIAYTAPYPAPLANETTVDAALSSELILRDLAKYATNNGETVQNFDALLVASYTQHPLINALRESYDVPVIGIMEGSIYVSRMLGARFGILATTNRHKLQQEDAIHSMGLDHFYVGSEAVHMSPSELLQISVGGNDINPTHREEMSKRIAHAARLLVARGADTLIMGSECMSSEVAIRAAKDAIREDDGRRTVNVVDCVEAGVLTLNGLVGMGVPTSKKGVFRGEREGRRGRGQNWL